MAKLTVLIADFDLFSKTGGGQTAYRLLIERHPQIEFSYLTVKESADAVRPINAHPVPFREVYGMDCLRAFHDLTPPRWVREPFVRASNIAASVSGMRFDVVESPDYEQVGSMLAPAMRHHSVDVGRTALSMHGTISTSVRLNWMSDGQINPELHQMELLQFRAADTRYGISQSYLEEWRALSDLPTHYISPLLLMNRPRPVLAPRTGEPPSLNFIGRTEKRKGPDIFIDLAWWLPPGSFSEARIIGPDSSGADGSSSREHLQRMAAYRQENLKILPGMSPEELQQLFAERSVTVLPSRYDSLNLLALESLFSGCPTAIGSGAGVCRLMADAFPGVPFVRIDVRNIFGCLPELADLLQNYDRRREQLVTALSKTSPPLTGEDAQQIYTSAPGHDRETRAEMERWYTQLMQTHERAKHSLVRRLRTVSRRVEKGLKTRLRRHILLAQGPTAYSPGKSRNGTSNRRDSFKSRLSVLKQLSRSFHYRRHYRRLFRLPEQSAQDLNGKLQQCWWVARKHRFDRGRSWGEIARLERIRGNELIAATYEIRVLRLLGEDRFGKLALATETLEAHGFHREAEAARALFAPSPEREERCQSLLDSASQNNKTHLADDYEFVDDRRTARQYRASIIVSLYHAAAKLPFFLQALRQQTFVQSGQAEIVLIDSGSPADERGVFQQCCRGEELPVLFVRTPQRETIQKAWNRGITLARAPYLSFLGVDEAILPRCLETLAAELDADPALDWVEGNSLVTNVDAHGTWLNDVMLYDRTGYRQDLAYLETCYLSWVGALYRRSIHERFGYYDPSFRAAGDTEFKNRVLPFIKSKALPQTLGVFLNYPEERTTHHPRAEIEDLRAWYLHRTLAGVKYAFGRRDPADAAALFFDCLGYRKSYYQHQSTDVEYADYLATYLAQVCPGSPVLSHAAANRRVLEIYRSLDQLDRISRASTLRTAIRTERLLFQQRHSSGERNGHVPAYEIFNDNRYEQHSFLWRTPVTSDVVTPMT